MKNESVEAYPLHWPPHRPRTKTRTRARFHRRVEEPPSSSGYCWIRKKELTIYDSRQRVQAELEKLGATAVIISSNLELRNDGQPRSQQRTPDDPGIAVYFQLNRQPHCLSCDTWDRAADNLAAIAKHVEAMRGQLRWGVADVASMFAGFKALPGAILTPPPMTVEDAAKFIALRTGASWDAVQDQSESFKVCYRLAAKSLHPDSNDGQQHPDWNRLQEAARVLREHHQVTDGG